VYVCVCVCCITLCLSLDAALCLFLSNCVYVQSPCLHLISLPLTHVAIHLYIYPFVYLSHPCLRIPVCASFLFLPPRSVLPVWLVAVIPFALTLAIHVVPIAPLVVGVLMCLLAATPGSSLLSQRTSYAMMRQFHWSSVSLLASVAFTELLPSGSLLCSRSTKPRL
jgi:hypothetical protein